MEQQRQWEEAIAVSRKGASSSIPTCEEVEQQIDTMQLSVMDSQKEREEIVKSYISAHLSDVKPADVAEDLCNTEMPIEEIIQKVGLALISNSFQ